MRLHKPVIVRQRVGTKGEVSVSVRRSLESDVRAIIARFRASSRDDGGGGGGEDVDARGVMEEAAVGDGGGGKGALVLHRVVEEEEERPTAGNDGDAVHWKAASNNNNSDRRRRSKDNNRRDGRRGKIPLPETAAAVLESPRSKGAFFNAIRTISLLHRELDAAERHRQCSTAAGNDSSNVKQATTAALAKLRNHMGKGDFHDDDSDADAELRLLQEAGPMTRYMLACKKANVLPQPLGLMRSNTLGETIVNGGGGPSSSSAPPSQSCLDLTHVAMGDVQAKAVTEIIETSELVDIRLSDNRLSGVGAASLLEHFTRAQPKSIRALDLSENPIGAKGAQALCRLVQAAAGLIVVSQKTGVLVESKRGVKPPIMLQTNVRRLTSTGATLIDGDDDSDGDDAGEAAWHRPETARLHQRRSVLRIMKLNLSNCVLGDTGTSVLCRAIASCDASRLNQLNLRGNGITGAGAKAIAMSGLLGTHGMVKTLLLPWNEIGSSPGAQALFEALREDTQCGTIDLSWCGLGTHGANPHGWRKSVVDAIARALASNVALFHVNFDDNRFSDDDTIVIAEALDNNHHLYGFHFRGQPCGAFIDSKGFLHNRRPDCDSDGTAAAAAATATTTTPISVSVSVSSFFRTTGLAEDEFDGLTCWCCESPWVEHQFLYTLPPEELRRREEEGDVAYDESLTVLLHLEIDGWRGDAMTRRRGDGTYEAFRMVPRAIVRYCFSFHRLRRYRHQIVKGVNTTDVPHHPARGLATTSVARAPCARVNYIFGGRDTQDCRGAQPIVVDDDDVRSADKSTKKKARPRMKRQPTAEKISRFAQVSADMAAASQARDIARTKARRHGTHMRRSGTTMQLLASGVRPPTTAPNVTPSPRRRMQRPGPACHPLMKRVSRVNVNELVDGSIDRDQCESRPATGTAAAAVIATSPLQLDWKVALAKKLDTTRKRTERRLQDTASSPMTSSSAHAHPIRGTPSVASAQSRKFTFDTHETDVSCHTALPRLTGWYDRSSAEQEYAERCAAGEQGSRQDGDHGYGVGGKNWSTEKSRLFAPRARETRSRRLLDSAQFMEKTMFRAHWAAALRKINFLWAHMRTPPMSAAQLDEIAQYIGPIYARIHAAFLFYSASGSSGAVNAFAMSDNQWSLFLSSCRLIDGRVIDHTVSSTIFSTAAANPLRPGRAAQILHPHSFVEALMRVAIRKYLQTRHTEDPVQAVRELIERFILPNAHTEDPNVWRAKHFYTYETEVAIQPHIDSLGLVFSSFSVTRSGRAGKPFMSHDEFIDLLGDAGFFNARMTVEKARRAFVDAKPCTDADYATMGDDGAIATAAGASLDTTHKMLTFIDFCEALMRVSQHTVFGKRKASAHGALHVHFAITVVELLRNLRERSALPAAMFVYNEHNPNAGTGNVSAILTAMPEVIRPDRGGGDDDDDGGGGGGELGETYGQRLI